MIGSVLSTALFYVVFAISLIGINITGVASSSDPDTALAASFERIGATWTA
jgi:energy-converting hydrogenase Eha subunit H